MAQHDNGRRAVGQQGGGQQGGHREFGGARGHQDQYDEQRGQQGDNWREQQGPAAGGWRPAMQEGDRSPQGNRGSPGGYGGQGSFGGQAADNDYGSRGLGEGGNFGNPGGQRDSNYDTLSGRGRYAQGGNHDQGGQSSQRFGAYRHGYDARSDSTGGYGSSNFGPDNSFGSGNYGGGDWNAGSYGSRGSNDFWRGRGRDVGPTYGQSSADDYQGSRGWQGAPNNQDRYGDNGYQGNFQQGQRGQAYHDPDYRQWRNEQLSRFDLDYAEWRQDRYQRFSEDFENWRANRDNDQGSPGRSGSQSGSGTSAMASGQQSASTDTSGQQAGASKHDVSTGGDKGAGKTATK
jgi:hypothetical protein